MVSATDSSVVSAAVSDGASADVCSSDDYLEDFKVYDYGVVNTTILLNSKEYESYVNTMFDLY